MRKLWNNFWDLIDPSRQGPLFWKYGWKGIAFIVLVTWGVHRLILSPVNHGSMVFQFFTIGVHEAGHPLFRYIFFGNFKMTIWGGTLMEIGVPILAYFWCLRRKWMIQSDICLLWIAMACYSIGHYAGCSLDPTITLLNATGPDAVPDWDYMHKWLGTEGYEWYVRHAFYWLSASFTGLGTYLAAVHFWKWNDPDKRNYNEDNDGYDFFNGMH